MLSILALGMLVALGAAIDGNGYESGPQGGDRHGDYNSGRDGGDHHDDRGFGGHTYNDWLNPGGYSYYSSYYWYPTYTYTYPTYTYPTHYYSAPAPAVYPAYNYYYDPVVYDPWYATNVYGWGGASYYYTNSWSWSHYGGLFF